MTLELDIADALPMILGYHDALAGAVSNVLLNAVDACAGKGTLTVRVAESSLDGRRAIQISIEDNGPGIGAQQLKRIWEPYVTNKAGGTGLGLAIARQAVWAHDGSVAAHSDIGKGTRIEFTLPMDTTTTAEV
jgi:signal transduction histidine kinase